jgi:hypothetical protein
MARRAPARRGGRRNTTQARVWIRKYGLGRKIAGRLRVDPDLAREFLRGVDFAAQAQA